MKKIVTLLLGLFVAGLAAYAVPKEIKEKPVDKVIKVFVVKEKISDVSVLDENILTSDEDIGVAEDDTSNELSPALHSPIFVLDAPGYFCRSHRYWQYNQGSPRRFMQELTKPDLTFHRIYVQRT